MRRTYTKYRELFCCDIPILLAGMGGISTPELAIAVGKSGAFGSVGLYRHTPVEIGLLLDKMYKHNCLFGVNFVSEVLMENEMLVRLRKITKHPSNPIITCFGLPETNVLNYLKSNFKWGVQVGSFEDARKACEFNADFIVLQTTDAGGHHLGKLLYADALSISKSLVLEGGMVFIAGGIGSSEKLNLVLNDNFHGGMCGTIFVTTTESNAHDDYKRIIVQSDAQDTIVTDAFSIGWSNRPHRVIKNDTCKKIRPSQIIGNVEYFGKKYPVPRYSVAVPTRKTSGKIEEMALYSGTSCGNIKVVENVSTLINKFREVL